MLPFLLLLLAPAADPEAGYDEQLLREQQVATDPVGLLDFFRRRTPTDADRRELDRLVRQLGSDRFGEREEASRELTRRGPAALPALRQGLQSDDAEVVRRARKCIAVLESGPGPALPAAAARVLAQRRPAEAVPVLLAYLPFADDESVEDEVLAALVTLSAGKGDGALAAALKDQVAVRRGAAAYALGRLPAQREATRGLLADPDLRVRFRAAQGLLAGRDRDAVPALIDLLRDGPADLVWRVESLLYQLAGEQAPSVPAGDGSPAARAKRRDAWAGWWEEHGAKIDLAKLQETPVLLGFTVGISWNANKVWEVGPDGKVRWELSVPGPMDAQVLPGGRVLIAEAGSGKVTERDQRGNVLWEHTVGGEPLNCLRLPNGNTWVGTRNGVLEVTRAGKVLYEHKLPGSPYCHGVSRTRQGGAVFITNTGQVIELDAAGKQVRALAIPHEGSWGDVEALPGGRYLVTNYTTHRAFEIDPAGKVVWEQKIDGACGGRRLPNGHTLLACPQRMVEIDRAGKQVWQSKAEGFVRRAHRR